MPPLTVRARLYPDPAQAEDLLGLCRRWASTFRWAWKRIARHNDASIVRHLNALHAGQRSRPPRLKRPTGIWRQATAFSGLPSKLSEAAVQDALDKMDAYLRAHAERVRRRRRHGVARCHPARVVFGGRKFVRRLAQTRRGTPEHERRVAEWRLRRQGRVAVVRGRARDGGNALIRFDFRRQTARILIGFRRGRRVEIEVAFKTRHAGWREFERWASAGRPYSAIIRVRRLRPPQFEVLLSWDPADPPPEPRDGTGAVLGIDMNATAGSFIAWAVASPDGNLIARGRIPIRTARRSHRRTQCFEIAHRVLNIAGRFRASAVAVEDLRKPAPRRGSGMAVGADGRRQAVKGARASRRKVHGWPVQMFRDALERTAVRRRRRLIYVDPQYTSVIGRLKYAPPCNLSVHQAAALVIARRAQGRKERMPKALRVLSASVQVSSPVSGSGPSEHRGPDGSGSAAVKLWKQEGGAFNPWRGLDVPGLTARLAEAAPRGQNSPSGLARAWYALAGLRPGVPDGGVGGDRACEQAGRASDAEGPRLCRGP